MYARCSRMRLSNALRASQPTPRNCLPILRQYRGLWESPQRKPSYDPERFVADPVKARLDAYSRRELLRNHLHPIFLRDLCTCPQCVDPHSTQKIFRTTDIPSNIEVKSVSVDASGNFELTWNNDIRGYDAEHVTTLTNDYLDIHIRHKPTWMKDKKATAAKVTWDSKFMQQNLPVIPYESYMKTEESLWEAVDKLQLYGLLIIRGVPDAEDSVESVAQRIGPLRDSLYGRTWDVKSVPEAKNVAYTSQHLGLHMDLLYMENPPAFQFLHCLHNSCEGGQSLFSDAFQAAADLHEGERHLLHSLDMRYHYNNNGEHYYHNHRVLMGGTKDVNNIACVNYSPPFQAPNGSSPFTDDRGYQQKLYTLGKFARRTEAPENLFEYTLKQGECVVFNNRRILHGRKQFDSATGKRWLKGAYIDKDPFDSRWRVLSAIYGKKS